MTKPVSVIIIGGGHNGLVCATYLARAGYSVDLIEARDIVGGGSSPYYFAEGYRTPGLAHVIYGLNRKICRDLNIDLSTIIGEVSTVALDLDGKHIRLARDEVFGSTLSSKDQDAYKTFKREFRAYTKALEPLMMNTPPRLKDMDRGDKFTLAKLGWSLRFGLGADSMREFLRVGGINIFDVLNELFDSPALKGALSVDAVLGQHMGPRTPNTVLTFLHRLWGERQNQLSLSAVSLVTAKLETAARNAGVRIKTSAPVKRILVKNERAYGVELASGERFSGDIVVSNADAKTTFLDLIGAEHLDAMFCHRVNAIRQNGDVAKLHFAVNQLPDFKALSDDKKDTRLLIAPDMRYVEHAFNHAKYGEFSEHPVLEMTIPSLADASLAPPGHHVLSVNASFAPYKLEAGWESSRDAFVQRVVETITNYATNFSDSIVATELLTPEDIERRFNIKGGHWHQGEMGIDQLFMMRPVHGAAQYEAPLNGLFLCGASTHPGGGITGVPGHNAAQRILRGVVK
ncbi:MAG: NAD(P)/FAD-dependent oxidoreductase [Porticoccaceae bacterium]|nr:NAD(P)/FAD-dependent oxidoreductase [Porticoccaceae bacterium]MDG1474690.1 NAD(P)/FAD-dependent oxidoreductase [Porticoccaceae bacterium]